MVNFQDPRRATRGIQVIPEAAVEAAARALAQPAPYDFDAYPQHWMERARAALEAAAPHMQQEAELMRWKLDALSKWADAMIDESYYPQYGRDVKTILDVSSIEETKEDFGDD